MEQGGNRSFGKLAIGIYCFGSKNHDYPSKLRSPMEQGGNRSFCRLIAGIYDFDQKNHDYPSKLPQPLVLGDFKNELLKFQVRRAKILRTFYCLF